MSTGFWPTCGECGVNESTAFGLCRECARTYRVEAVLRGDYPAWNADNECTLCGEHMADPHDPNCEIELRGEGA